MSNRRLSRARGRSHQRKPIGGKKGALRPTAKPVKDQFRLGQPGVVGGDDGGGASVQSFYGDCDWNECPDQWWQWGIYK